MNLYNYWLRLQGMYPSAVADCVAHFQQAHRDNWRDQFKDPDQLLQYLERRHITITTQKRQERQIRFELRAYEESTTTAFLFQDRETALYDAIERALRILEQRSLRSQTEPFQRQRKTKPDQSHLPTWQERLKASGKKE
jgi:hypothetical protein